MTLPSDRRPSWRLRAASAVVRVAGRLAPPADRGDWLREWQAELDDRVAMLEARHELTARAEMDLLRRCLGGVAHALWLRRQEWTADMLLHDLRSALRSVVSQPGVFAVAVLTLALGIGAATTIFSVVYGVLLRPLPFEQPDRLVQLWESNPLKNWTHATVAPANLKDWLERSRSFESAAFYFGADDRGPTLDSITLVGEGRPERLRVLLVSPDFFAVLGVAPALGRGFRAGEDVIGQHRVMVLSHGLWVRRFGGDPHVVGREVRLDGSVYAVVGVMGAGFRFPSPEVDFWAPMAVDQTSFWQLRRPHFLRVVARLKAGVTVRQARTDLSAIAADLERAYPDTNRQMGAGLSPIQEWTVDDARQGLLLLLAAVAGLLLIACANVAGLLLVRGAGRAHELAVRVALGAGRTRLFRQLLTESALVAFAGGALGVLFAEWGLEIFRALAPADLPRLAEVRLDLPVLAAATGMTGATVAVAGLLPALRVSRVGNDALKEGARGTTGGSQRARRALVVAEVFLSALLVVAAGLLVRSFEGLMRVAPGFDADQTLTFAVSLPGRYDDDAKVAAFFARLIERLETIPGVEAAGATSRMPLSGYRWTGDLYIEGRPEAWGQELRHKEATPGYFEAMGVRILRGRTFTWADDLNAPPVVVVNDALAREFFSGEDPVGRRITYSKGKGEPRWTTIIGVVGDEKQDGLGVATRPEVFDAQMQRPTSEMTLVLRSAAPVPALAADARAAVAAVDPELAIYDVETMAEVVSGSVARQRFAAALVGSFAVLAVALAGVGLYGLMAFAVGARTREIGVRMALGARRGEVVGAVLAEGLRLVLLGLGAGLAAAAAFGGLMSTLLFGVTPIDPLTYAGVAAVFLAVAIVAAAVPARRAARVDPLVALRAE